MAELSATERHDIEKLADSFMAAYRAGKRPSIEEFARQYPALADELRDLLQALVILEQNVPRPASKSEPAALGFHTPPTEIGDFLIVREIGRGGMGVVYEAMQQSLGRHVALKVLYVSSRMNSSHLERFRLESRAAARLHHSHIVPVFGVGECDNIHYYAMQFIQGQSLDLVIDALRKLRKPSGAAIISPRADELPTIESAVALSSAQNDDAAGVVNTIADNVAKVTSASSTTNSELSASQSEREYFRSVARVGLQVADALAYAHGEGILHRDVKPSNLLLDAKANVWITDFGLAKAEDTEGVTKTGDFVGTLRYMAPERLEGWSDRRSDIYGLGATLYELLTLRPLFEGANGGNLIDSILRESPAPPSKFDRQIPQDLETIVLKAIAKEPASRYRTADALAEDLQRFLEDRPILARRSTNTERLVRWCRRNPAISALSAAVAVLLVGASTILAISNAHIRRESAAREVALIDRTAALAKAREAVDQLLVRVSEDQLFDVPQADPIRRGLLKDALGFYESFVSLNEQDESLRFQLAEVCRRLASVENSFDPSQARELNGRSVRLFEGLVLLSPGNYQYRGALAKALEDQGYFFEQLRTPEGRTLAEASCKRCLEIRNVLQIERPASLQNRCTVLFRLGRIANLRRDAAAATEYWQQGIADAEAILAKESTDVDALSALHYCSLAIAGQPTCKDRERMLNVSLVSAEAQTQARGNFSVGRCAVAESKFELANYYRDSGKPENAVDLFQQCWRGLASVCADRPNITPAWRTMRTGLNSGIKVLRQLKRDEDAIKWVDEFCRWLSEVESKLTDNPTAHGEYFECQVFAARRLKSLGKVKQSDEFMQLATKRLAGLPISLLKSASSQTRGYYSDGLTARAEEHCRQEKWSEAGAEIAKAIELADDGAWSGARKKSLSRWAASTPQIFDELRKLRPDDATIWIGHAQQCAACSDWDGAAKDFERVVEKRPIYDEWFEYAYLLALRGDDAGYENLCKKFSDKMDGQKGSYENFAAARACAIKPAKCVTAAKVCEWADRSLDERLSWRLHVAGLAYLRAANFKRAIELFRESISDNRWGEPTQAQNWFGLTIAYKQLGQEDEARDSLAEGRKQFPSAQPSESRQASPVREVTDWIGLILLSREAEACISGANSANASQTAKDKSVE